MLLDIVAFEVIEIIADYVGTNQLSQTCKRLWDCLGCGYIRGQRGWEQWEEHYMLYPHFPKRNLRVFRAEGHYTRGACVAFAEGLETLLLEGKQEPDSPSTDAIPLPINLRTLSISFGMDSDVQKEPAQQALKRAARILKHMGSLTQLNLAANELRNTLWWDEALKNKPLLSSLKLDLSHCSGTGDAAATTLSKRLQECPDLSRLNFWLHNTEVTNAGLTAFLQNDHMNFLGGLFTLVLDISANMEISDESVLLLAQWLSKGNYLRTFSLHLHTTRVGDKGAMAVAVQVAKLPRLVDFTLNLTHTKISDQTVHGLVCLKTAPVLKNLTLHLRSKLTTKTAQEEVAQVLRSDTNVRVKLER